MQDKTAKDLSYQMYMKNEKHHLDESERKQPENTHFGPEDTEEVLIFLKEKSDLDKATTKKELQEMIKQNQIHSNFLNKLEKENQQAYIQEVSKIIDEDKEKKLEEEIKNKKMLKDDWKAQREYKEKINQIQKIFT